MRSWWVSLDLDAAAIYQRDQDEIEGGWAAMANYARWCLLRRIYSERQVLEVMTEFWENHLHVPIYDDGVFTYRADYGKVIRSHALGRFDQMLVAAIPHPAMGISLDNARSTKKAPNENLGRELLELHTVGKGNHTEDDVKDSAKILTGYRVDMWTATWRAYYDTASHWTGPVKVLDFTHPNTDPDGRAVTEAYLTYLARHPKTAEKIARKLAVRFVSDTPSDALVAQLAQVFLDNDTEIKPVLRALVASAEFKAAAGLKARTPTDDVVATHRVLRHRDRQAGRRRVRRQLDPVADLAHRAAAVRVGPARRAARGQPVVVVGVTAVGVLRHPLLDGGAVVAQAGHDLPRPRLVDARSRASGSTRWSTTCAKQLLGKPAPARLLTACTQATGVAAGTTITTSHAIMRWQFPILLTTLLDTPDHMHR